MTQLKRGGFGRAGLCGALLALTGMVVQANDGIAIRVLSNRADLISGNDARIVVDLPADTDVTTLRFDVDGRDVGSAFARRTNGRVEALLSDLAEGSNRLRVRRDDGSGAQIELRNHLLHGPVFAGPQVLPWSCHTEAVGLGPSEPPYCEAASVYTYFYVPQSCLPLVFASIDTGGIYSNCLFGDYDPANPPSDVSTTTTDQGKTVPFIIRVETGVIDRGIFRIATLWDPAHPDIEAWAPRDNFNGKLLMTFGGDCKPRHGQGSPIEVRDVAALSRGFSVMTSNLNILGQNCNDVVSAESVMMLKEYFIERYGDVRYTIGNGASGGSIQQHWIVSNYPGLLDGIQPSASFPDMWQLIVAAQDCNLLQRVFNQLSPLLWPVLLQRGWASGYATPLSCQILATPPLNFAYAQITMDPDNEAACQGDVLTGIPTTSGGDTSYVYDAQTNPAGTRCTVQDYQVALWGRRTQDGFANRPYDNVGVQYGLQALEQGLISVEQFVDLNEKIGGIDIDWNFQAQRSEADADALRVAYRGGRVTQPREAAKVPIIDLRGTSSLEIHTDVHSHSMRARLDAANGHHDNQIMWVGVIPLFQDPVSWKESLNVLDRWLSAIEADTSSDPKEVKVQRHRPEDAVDACWIAGQKVTDRETCERLFPHFGTPRIAAGGPLADDIFKCQLRPLDRNDYDVQFSDAQWQRLQAAFPDGVCNYLLPGVGVEPTIPWLNYANGPGGEPLGEVPASEAIGGGGVDKPEDAGRFGSGALSPLLLLGLMLLALLRHLDTPCASAQHSMRTGF
ncbi:MAG: DUF6351 family protein [Pseudomonadota bacterium]|nr:DUF6351 family protein [Pseudomonadota bacterium]